MVHYHVFDRLWPALVLGLLAAGCGGKGGGSAVVTPEPVPADAARQIYGLNMGLFTDGPAPGSTTLSEAQVRSKLAAVKPYTRWVRFFGMGWGQGQAAAIAHSLGLRVAMSAWVDKNPSVTRAEVDALEAAIRAGSVDLAIVGTEPLRQKLITPAGLAALINEVKGVAATAPNGQIPVGTAEIYPEILDPANRAVLDAESAVMVNIYPFWESVPVENAVQMLDSSYWLVRQAAGGRPVWIGETGWPSAGGAQGPAVASPENAARYFQEFVSWAAQNDVPYLYHESHDEPWKVADEGAVGAHWGIWTAQGAMKPGFDTVFAGGALPAVAIDRTPRLSLVQPPAGSTADLWGRVMYLDPAGKKIALYINVPGAGWWQKPHFGTDIALQPGGSWTSPWATGGSDAQATEYAVFLLPAGYAEPQLAGTASLPDSLKRDAAAWLVAPRSE